MKIRNLMNLIGVGLLAGLIALPASAESIGGGATEVGSIDTVLGQDDTNLGDFSGTGDICDGLGGTALEECWAESVVGTDLDFDNVKTQNVTWEWCDSGDCIAFPLVDGPGYYIVKNSTTRIIVENLVDVNYGVIDDSWVEYLGLGDDMIISHVTEFDGGDTPVPEPGTLGLLGLGLFALGAARRKVRRS